MRKAPSFAPALPRPEPKRAPQQPMAIGPFSFVGATALLFAIALLPGGHLAAGLLADAGLPALWAALAAGLCFPALLLPTLPQRARTLVLAAGRWTRAAFALPPILTAIVVIQLVVLGSYGDLSAAAMFAALGFCFASGACGALLLMRDLDGTLG